MGKRLPVEAGNVIGMNEQGAFILYKGGLFQTMPLALWRQKPGLYRFVGAAIGILPELPHQRRQIAESHEDGATALEARPGTR